MTVKPYGLAVCALIGDETGQYLFLKRARKSKHFAGLWELPGGKMDPGESLAEAVVREVQEETSITVSPDAFAAAAEFEFPQVKVVLLCFRTHRVSGELRLSDEHEEGAWLTPAEVFARGARPPLRQLLEQAGVIGKTKQKPRAQESR